MTFRYITAFTFWEEKSIKCLLLPVKYNWDWLTAWLLRLNSLWADLRLFQLWSMVKKCKYMWAYFENHSCNNGYICVVDSPPPHQSLGRYIFSISPPPFLLPVCFPPSLLTYWPDDEWIPSLNTQTLWLLLVAGGFAQPHIDSDKNSYTLEDFDLI